MKEIIQFKENGIHCHIEVTDDGEVRLLHLGPMPGSEVDERHARWHRLVEVQEIGMNQNDHHGSKHTGTQPGALLRYWMHRDVRNENGRLLELTQEYDGLMLWRKQGCYENIKRKSTDFERNQCFLMVAGAGPSVVGLRKQDNPSVLPLYSANLSYSSFIFRNSTFFPTL